MTSAPDRTALWRTLPALPVTWAALPEQGITLSEGTHLFTREAPDGTSYLDVTLHASEDFTELFDGRGNYTDEELDDPYAVIEERWEEARGVLWAVLAEAAQVLGEPPRAEAVAPGRVNWPLADRTICIGLDQADKDCPIEVCLWLLPPGLTPDRLGL